MRQRSVAAPLIGCILVLLVAGSNRGAAAASTRLKGALNGAAVTAHLTSTEFTASQTLAVELVYRFSTVSRSFSYRLALERGKTWETVRSVARKGHFAGSHTVTVNRLFGSKPVKVGSYRLRIAGDVGGEQLSFAVTPRDSRSRAHTIGGIVGATQVEAGGGHACALVSDGAVECWGWNLWGQLGNGTTNTSISPVRAAPLAQAVQISAGFEHTCAVVSGGDVYCWGGAIWNLADPTDFTVSANPNPVQVTGISGAVQVSASIGYHNCALLSGGAVECWGANFAGELGNGTKLRSFTPVGVVGVSDAVQIATGYQHSCALRAGGAVECWGWNQYGQLGDGKKADSSTPVPVLGIKHAVQISAGLVQTCALISGGKIECWGGNQWGQLGNGEKSGSAAPTMVRGITNATEISAGDDHTCALLADRTVKCWGLNFYGQLGYGSTITSSIPLQVPGIANAVQVSAGSAGYIGGSDTCALISGGAVKCWGDDEYGQLGSG